MGEKQGEYDPKKDLGATTRFLVGILGKGETLARHIDTQVNIFLGISSAIFIFSATQLRNEGFSIAWPILVIFSALSTFSGLLAIHPPKFLRKRGQGESLMYNRRITGYHSPEEYETDLNKIIGNQDAITKEFAVEIYNLAKYYYRPKRKLFNISRNLLLAGVLVSFTVFTIELFL